MPQIDVARNWFFEHCLPLLEQQFPELCPRIAAGLAGKGSECFGFDDEISSDHDFDGGIFLWITPEDDREYGFPLMRCYNTLLKEFPCGFSGSAAGKGGSGKRGVTVIGDFFRRHLGYPGVPQNWQQWLYTPEYAFAEVLNGEVFMDEAGVFSGIRRQIAGGMPDDVRKKKLAYRAVMMAQSGQYNFSRCLKHGEKGAAALALSEFVRHSAAMIYLLNGRFAPYYKWIFRGMRSLSESGALAGQLESLLTGKLSDREQIDLIEEISAAVIGKLTGGNWSTAAGNYLEDHAYAIQSTIVDREIRSLHIMEG